MKLKLTKPKRILLASLLSPSVIFLASLPSFAQSGSMNYEDPNERTTNIHEVQMNNAFFAQYTTNLSSWSERSESTPGVDNSEASGVLGILIIGEFFSMIFLFWYYSRRSRY